MILYIYTHTYKYNFEIVRGKKLYARIQISKER